jgi:hypothetical protein
MGALMALTFSTLGGAVNAGAITSSGIVSATQLNLTDGITAPAATVGVAKVFVDTADGDLKIEFGDDFDAVIQADS